MPVILEELDQLISKLENADDRDTSAFSTLLQESISLLNIQQKEVAEQFAISPASVTRWVQGKNAPIPPARRAVYAWLRKCAQGMRSTLQMRRSMRGGGHVSRVPWAASSA